MSPTLVRDGPFRLFFFSREERRPHVHVSQARNAVERPTADHLYWPKLDIDLALASIDNPDAFPQVARSADKE